MRLIRSIAASSILGVLAGLAGAQPLTVTRSTEFVYHPTTGLLTLERVDPGGTHCVETAYTHDAFGNRQTVEVRPCSNVAPGDARYFAPRVTTNYFEASTDPQNLYPAGAYQTRSTSGTAAAIMAESRATYAPAFGSAATQTEVALADNTKNLSKRTTYDGFGRVAREYIPSLRNANNSVLETSVGYTYNYCLGPKATSPSAACLNFTLSVPVNYASQRLVDRSTGAITTTAAVPFVSAYFIESTPYGTDGVTVIGAKTRAHFDSLHRQIAKETQAYDRRWVRTLTGYDALGQTAATWGAYFVADNAPQTQPPAELRQWTSVRDNLHRPTEQQQYWRDAPGATAVALIATVNYNGLETTATVPAGSAPNGVARSVLTRKNAAGQTAQTVNADGATLNMAYDPAGNLIKTVDALGYATTVSYTAGTARFKTGMVDPDQGSWSYTYDALGQLKSQTDARLKTIAMSYDELGRMVSKTTPTFAAYWYHARTEAGAWCAYGLNRPCESKTGNTASVTRQSNGYDTLGRAVSSTNTLDRAYTSRASFDTFGRLSSTTYPSGLRVNYAYSAGTGGKVPGVLERVFDNANAARVFWRIDTLTASQVFDAQGHLLKAQLGNGVVTDHVFDPIAGKAFNLRAGTSGSNSNVFDQRYTYDRANNLATRTEGLSGVVENFAYDVLDRMTQYQVQSASDAGAARTVNLKYNALGNILEKGDVGGYSYNASVRPHAVQSAGGTSYLYDNNGNLLSSAGVQSRTQSWTDFNQPDTLSYQGKRVAFSYDASYKRVKEVTTDGSTVRTLFLVHPDNSGGLGYEREETRVGGTLTRNENRHFISVGGAVVAVVKTLNSGDPLTGPLNGVVSTDATLTQYWHKDALGSIVAVTNASAGIERMAFDAWGRRLRDTGRVDTSVNPSHGDRGYTGHEHLDELALVHMNGRVFDPVLARFLSADPVLQSPTDLQSYNRFSYVLNNPLKYTDPSGQFLVELFVAIASVALIDSGNKHWKMVGQIALMWALGGDGGLIESGLGNVGEMAASAYGPVAPSVFNNGYFVNSFLAASGTSLIANGGDVGRAVADGMFAGAFTYAGGIGSSLSAERLFAHAFIGCVQGQVNGGSCGPSALAAFASKAMTGSIPEQGVNPVSRGVITAIAGGTASVIGGGKFANGAYQAGFGYLFNELATTTSRIQRGFATPQETYWYKLGWIDASGNPVPYDPEVARRALAGFTDVGGMAASLGTAACISFAACAAGAATGGVVLGTAFSVTNSIVLSSPTGTLWDTFIDWGAGLVPLPLRFWSQTGAEVLKKTDTMDGIKRTSDDAAKKLLGN